VRLRGPRAGRNTEKDLAMFRNAMLSLVAVLAVTSLPTAGNAKSDYVKLWEKHKQHRHWYLYKTDTALKKGNSAAGAIRSLSSCGARWYRSVNGQCYPILN
jgi:hypothetical protein